MRLTAIIILRVIIMQSDWDRDYSKLFISHAKNLILGGSLQKALINDVTFCVLFSKVIPPPPPLPPPECLFFQHQNFLSSLFFLFFSQLKYLLWYHSYAQTFQIGCFHLCLGLGFLFITRLAEWKDHCFVILDISRWLSKRELLSFLLKLRL